MAKIPDELRREVIVALYEAFDEMQWEERTQTERSVAYQRFVDDPSIGGRLSVHIPSDQIRVWIKDGPAKEYRRALEGVGPYVRFTTRRTSGADSLVAAVLGRQWSVVEKSVEDKPMRCLAERGDEVRLVVWGPESTLKDLFWHVAVHLVETKKPLRALIAVTKRGNAPIDAAQWQRAQRLGALLDFDVVQSSSSVTQRTEE